MLMPTANIRVIKWRRIGSAELAPKPTYQIRPTVHAMVKARRRIILAFPVPDQEFACPERVAAIPPTPVDMRKNMLTISPAASSHPSHLRDVTSVGSEVVATSVSEPVVS